MKGFFVTLTLILVLIVVSVLGGTASDLRTNGGTIQDFNLHADIEIPCINAIVSIEPEAIQISSPEQSMTTFIELPTGYLIEDIVTGTVRLGYDSNGNGAIEEGEQVSPDENPSSESCSDFNCDGRPELKVTFNCNEIISLLNNSTEEELLLNVTGQVGWKRFSGSCGISLLD